MPKPGPIKKSGIMPSTLMIAKLEQGKVRPYDLAREVFALAEIGCIRIDVTAGIEKVVLHRCETRTDILFTEQQDLLDYLFKKDRQNVRVRTGRFGREFNARLAKRAVDVYGAQRLIVTPLGLALFGGFIGLYLVLSIMTSHFPPAVVALVVVGALGIVGAYYGWRTTTAVMQDGLTSIDSPYILGDASTPPHWLISDRSWTEHGQDDIEQIHRALTRAFDGDPFGVGFVIGFIAG